MPGEERGPAEGGFLSIGEVLELLRAEFPDVTISKILFLESQGLVTPERTPSGYRKFFDEDVARLRWVLRQQREHYLPLKVIRGRLESGGRPREDEEQQLFPMAPIASSPVGPVAPVGRRRGRSSPARLSSGDDRVGSREVAESVGLASPSDVSLSVGSGDGLPARGSGDGSPQAGVDDGSRVPGSVDIGGSANEGAYRDASDGSSDPWIMAREELAEEAGVKTEVLSDLEAYGLISGERVGGVVSYREAALTIARLASELAGYGFDARHLAVFRHAAEREAGIVEQAVTPLLLQRNPEARARAAERARALLKTCESFHGKLLEARLEKLLGL